MNRLVQVDCQKRFPMYQASSMYQVAGFGRGSAYHEDLEQLPVDWERGIIFHCRLIRRLGILSNHSFNSFFLANPVFVM